MSECRCEASITHFRRRSRGPLRPLGSQTSTADRKISPTGTTSREHVRARAGKQLAVSDPQDAPELLAHDPRSVFAISGQGEEGPEHVPTVPLGQAASLTSIFLAWLRAGFGMVTFKTPFDNVAFAVEGSMPSGDGR